MGALRKAGVWLGLVEDEDDLEYDDTPGDAYDKPYSRQRTGSRDGSAARRAGDRDRYQDDFDDDEELELPRLARSRSDRPGRLGLDASGRLGHDAAGRLGHDASDHDDGLARAAIRDTRDTRLNVEARLEQARAERATVRPITARPLNPAPMAPIRENLALAPQAKTQPVQRVSPAATEDERRAQITTLHPTTYNEARQIGERFRDGSPVIMNLTEMDEPDAKRLVDFAAGLAFGLRGTMERVTNRVFLLSPANVQVTAEDKARIAEGGFLNPS